MPGQYVIIKLFKIQIYGFQARTEKAKPSRNFLALRFDTKKGCVADLVSKGYHMF